MPLVRMPACNRPASIVVARPVRSEVVSPAAEYHGGLPFADYSAGRTRRREHHQQELRHVWGAAGDIAGQPGQQVAGAGGSVQHLECVVGADLQPLGEDALACSMAILLVSEACSCAAATSLRRTVRWCKMPIVAASARVRAIRSSMRLGSARQSGRGRWRGRWPELLLDAVGRAADRNAGRECALSRFGPAAGLLGAPCWKKDVVGSVVSAGRLMPPDKALSAAQRRLARSELGPHHRARHHGVRR